MTRFARAKGSKSSNEKAPEDGTPWEVMKEQLLKAKHETEDAKNREQAEKQRIENYENFLKERKVQKRTATWCDFPEDKTQQNGSQTQAPSAKKKKKNKKSAGEQIPKTNDQSEPQAEKPQELHESNASNGKKKKNKKNKQNLQITPDSNQQQSEEQNSTATDNIAVEKKSKNKNKANKSLEQEKTANKSNPNNQNKFNPNTKKSNDGNQQKKAKKKLENGQPTRRKEIDDRSFQLIINGKEVELVRFDGFPVMKRDAERLQELKNSMTSKGIPKSEVQRTMKLERRRAEKALARLKRDVCYNCRKGGHNLSDCPELKSKIPGVDGADGMCFKCGSTEHRQFECKVQRDKEFRFATCFICKEQGHIARQCPDNPKGLYPNGGSCKLCGDVTHLRKDCPTVKDKKEDTSVKLQTLETTDNIEDIGQKPTTVYNDSVKKPKKITF